MRIGLVVNPVSGAGRGRRYGRLALEALGRSGAEIRFCETAEPGHAARLGRMLAGEGFGLVVALGGDGTVSDVADGLMRAAREDGAALPEFAFVAAGTGMDFRRNFNLPADPAAAIAAILAAPARPVDVGEVTCTGPAGETVRRYFLNVASIGLSGTIAASVNAAKARGKSGSSLYITHSIREILRYRAEHLTVRIDDGPVISGPAGVVAIANGGWFGGGMRLAPGADPRDGRFEVVMMQGGSRLRTLWHLALVATGGRHRGSRGITFLSGRSVEIGWNGETGQGHANGGQGPVLEMDGETVYGLPARYTILPGALMLRA